MFLYTKERDHGYGIRAHNLLGYADYYVIRWSLMHVWLWYDIDTLLAMEEICRKDRG